MAKGSNAPKSPHIPNTMRQSLLHNSHFSAEVEKSLADTLKTQNVKSPYEFIDNLSTTLDWKNNNGILESMSNPSNPTPYPVDFNTIKNENFSLQELEKVWQEALISFPPFTTPHGTVHLESVISEIVKNDIATLMQGQEKIDFLAHVGTNSSLSAIIRDVDFFVNTMLPNSKNKKNLKNEINNYRLPFAKIKSRLEARGVDFAQINAGSQFASWPDEQKKLFDAMTSSMLITRMQDRVQQMTDLMRGVDGVFNQILPPLSTFLKKYPFDFQKLKQKYPSEADQIEQHYAKITEDTPEEEKNQILEEVQQMELDLYLKDLEAQNSQIAAILKKLIQEKFDFSKLTLQELTTFFSDLAKARIQEMKDKNVMEVFEQYNSADFESFFLDLFDFSKGELNLDGHKLKITKTADGQLFGGISSLQDMASMTEMPIAFTLSGFKEAGLSAENLQMLEQLFGKELMVDDEKVELKGKDIGKLMYLYLMMKKGSILGAYRPQSVEGLLKSKQSLDNEGEKLNSLLDDFKKEEKSDPSNPEPKPSESEGPKTPEELKSDFYKSRDAIKGEKSDAPNHGFAPGAVMYVKAPEAMESMLPPFSDATTERMKVEITDIDESKETFKVKMFGTEVKLSDAEEGKELSYSFSDFDAVFGKGNSKFDDVIKILPGRKNPEQVLAALAPAGVSSDNLSDIQIRDGKFYFDHTDLEGKSSEQEATYFGTTDEVPDQNGAGVIKNTILYKVTPKGNGKLIVSGNLPSIDGERGKYEKEMSYPDFLLFVANKKLFPKSEESAKAEEAALQDIHSKKTRKWSRVSPAAMIASVKNVWKNLNGKIDEYYKEQESACLDRLIGDFGVYDKIGKMLPGFKSVSSATRKLQDEHLSKKEGEAWKGIESWVKIFGSMQDFSSLFEKGYDFPSGRRIDYAIGKGNTLKSILLSGKSVVEDGDLRPIMAAAMISNIKKGKGLYRGISDKENMGLWVKCLLGDAHYKRYMQMKSDVIKKIKTGAMDADQLQDRLKTSEIEYIANNIQNDKGGQDFGSIDDGNAQVLKQIYSNQFADEVRGAANDMFGKDQIEKAYKGITHNNFNLSFADFKKNIKSSRFEGAIANLMKMGMLAGKNPKYQKQVKIGLTYLALSGIMNRYGDKKTRKHLDSLARTMQVPTAFGAKKRDNQKDAWYLMNRIPGNPKFSDALAQEAELGGKKRKGIKESDFSMTSPNLDYDNLLERLWTWWGNNSDSVDKYFDSLFVGNMPTDPVEKKVYEQLWDSNSDNVFTDWAGNSALMGSSPLNKPIEVIRKNLDYDQNGFRGEDVDQRNDKEAFWKEAKKDLEKVAKDGNTRPEMVLKLYLKWFGWSGFPSSNYPEYISRIQTAKHVKSSAGKQLKMKMRVGDGAQAQDQIVPLNSTYSTRDYEAIFDYLFKGNVLGAKGCTAPKAFEDVMNFFVKYFTEHMDEMDEKFFSETFGKTELNDARSRPKVLIPWEEYNKYRDQNGFGEYIDKKNPIEKAKIQMYKKSGLFINGDLMSLERNLKNKRIPMKESFSNFDTTNEDDYINEFYDMAS